VVIAFIFACRLEKVRQIIDDPAVVGSNGADNAEDEFSIGIIKRRSIWRDGVLQMNSSDGRFTTSPIPKTPPLEFG
jgi:hypothetical protein